MYSSIKLGWLYFKYWISASNGKGHGIHSPFVFTLITKVFNDERHFYAFETIPNEATAKYTRLLFRLVDFLAPQQVVELNATSNIMSLYLAAGNLNASVTLFVESIAVLSKNRQIVELTALQNIAIVEGKFEDVFTPRRLDISKMDFIFINTIHADESTLRIFNTLVPYIQHHSVVAIADIHSSREREQAWLSIKTHPSVTLTIDIFFIGLVFFRKEQAEKEDFIIRY
jgi:hypothetical protein